MDKLELCKDNVEFYNHSKVKRGITMMCKNKIKD